MKDTMRLFQGAIDVYVILNESNRFYFTQIDTSFGCVVLTRERNYFLTDFRYQFAAEAALPDWEVRIVTSQELYPAIAEIVKAADPRQVGVECDLLTYSRYMLLKEVLRFTQLTACDTELVLLRAIKTEEEIALIARSQEINETALSRVFALMKPKMTERELYAEYCYQLLKAGADGFSFDPIVAAGAGAAQPHHKVGDTVVGKDDPVLFDVGAKYRGYCSDLTRTVCMGTPDREMVKLYDLVARAQNFALGKIKAGITCHEADGYAREYFTANGVGKLFGHTLGHGVGVDIHEYPRVGAAVDVVLEANMVITVEPGLYVEGLGGVRIEDTVVVTESGIRNLTSLHKKFEI